MNLSPNFTLDELIRTDHRSFDNTPNDVQIANLKRLAAFLELVRTAVGDKPIIINSAFRSKAVNDAVGSKDSSQHRLGCAADFRVVRMTPDAVVRAIIAAKLPFDQIAREFDSWTHISVPSTPASRPRGSKLIIDRTGTKPFV